MRRTAAHRPWPFSSVRQSLTLSVCVSISAGHAVCRECLTQHRRRSTDCPVCRQSFADSKLASQHFVQSMVWQLRVRCLQHDKGCGWQGPLGTEMRELKAHDAECAVKQAMCRLCATRSALPKRRPIIPNHVPCVSALSTLQGRAGRLMRAARYPHLVRQTDRLSRFAVHPCRHGRVRLVSAEAAILQSGGPPAHRQIIRVNGFDC